LGNIFLFFFAQIGGGMVVCVGTVCPCPEIWGGTTVPFGTARPCQIPRTRPVLIGLVRSGPGIAPFGPQSTPSPDFDLRSRPVRSGPGLMHRPSYNHQSIHPDMLHVAIALPIYVRLFFRNISNKENFFQSPRCHLVLLWWTWLCPCTRGRFPTPCVVNIYCTYQSTKPHTHT